MSKTNFLMCFPGQGSQKVGMLAELAEKDPLILECYREASDVLGIDLWALVSEGPAEKLQLTEHAQPALLVAGVALWRRWLAAGGAAPSCMAGHSLGECTALVCADAISFADGVSLVRERGRLMQAAVPPEVGAMHAILGLETEKIKEICASLCTADNVVELVNYNAPGQMVIAGHKDIAAQAAQSCLDAGAKKSIPLPVSAPFHTQLMQTISDDFQAIIDGIEIKSPSIPIVHNVHAKTESDPKLIGDLLVKQLYSPVLWIDCVRYCIDQAKATDTVECGPGKVLSGLNKRIDKMLNCHYLESDESFSATVEAFS